MKNLNLPWQASLSNWMRGWLKKETGGKKSPGDQNPWNRLVGIILFSKRRKTLKKCEILLEKGGWNSKKTLTHPGDGASHMSPLTPSPTSLCSRFSFSSSSKKPLIGFFLQEQIEQGVVLLDATGQTIDEILGKAANSKSKSIETIIFFKMRCWRQKLGTTWTQSRGRESTISSRREWSTRCGWTSCAKCQRRRNSKWVVWQAARVRIR